MERLDFVNADRLRWCCADHGITEDELATESGVSKSALDKVLQGERGLTYKQLKQIADYFGRGILFFLEGEGVTAEQVHTPQFRTLANKKPQLSAKFRRLIERVEKHRDFFLALKEDTEAEDFPRFEPPDLAALDTAEAARIARQWLGLGPNNTFDSYRLAVESRGILVFRSNGYNGNWQIAKSSPILGFSLYDANCPVIVIKKLDWEAGQSFTLMHELGHVLLHRASSIDDEGDMQSHVGEEREANAFAGRVLVPTEFLREIDLANIPDDVREFDAWLAPQRNRWGVSAEVILRRLMDTNRLPRNLYNEYRAVRGQIPNREDEHGVRLYRYREPTHIFGHTYVRSVLTALAARTISITKATSYLDTLKVGDVHKLERFYENL